MTSFPAVAGVLALCACFALPAFALEYRVSGVDGELRDNVRAHLGPAPDGGLAAARALEAARARVVEALRALGYYSPVLTLEERAADGTPLPPSAPVEEVERLHIHIEPGERVRLRDVAISLSGEAEDNPVLIGLLGETPLVPGAPLDHGDYSRFKDDLQGRARALGFLDGRLEAHSLRIDPAALAADVTLRYVSGPRYAFGEVSHDEEQLSAERMAGILPFRAGDPYDQEKLQALRSRLLATGFFAGVSVVPEDPDRETRRVPVRVQLLAAPRHSLELGTGFSTDTGARVSALWRSPRLNSAGHSQETRLRWSPVNPVGSAVYRIPRGEALRDSVQLRARLEDDRFGDVDSLLSEIGARYEHLAGDWVMSAGLRALREDWTVIGLEFDADYLLPGVTLSQRQRRGSVVDPAEGFSQFYSIEGASERMGSASDLLRVYGTWSWIGGPGRPHRFVARLELGALLGGSEPPETRAPSLGFFAGGDQSIRGYDYQSVGYEVAVPGARDAAQTATVGGDRLVTGSLEYQHYLNDDWRLAVFTDAGDAFVDDVIDLKVGAGAGLHYLTPVGAIKLELANSVSETNSAWRIHINIGAEL